MTQPDLRPAHIVLNSAEYDVLRKVIHATNVVGQALGAPDDTTQPIWANLYDKIRNAHIAVDLTDVTSEALMAEVARRMATPREPDPEPSPGESAAAASPPENSPAIPSTVAGPAPTSPSSTALALVPEPSPTPTVPAASEAAASTSTCAPSSPRLLADIERILQNYVPPGGEYDDGPMTLPAAMKGVTNERDWEELGTETLTLTASDLAAKLAGGLPTSVRVTVTPDVLAMHGVDYESMAAAIHCPTRVEIRPETAEKKYPTLAFHRGDVNVIVGFRFPTKPAVMAVYWSSILTHDTHRVEHHGGGQSGRDRSQSTVPKQRRSLVTALRAAGCTIAGDPRSTSGAEIVTFKGQEIGRISGEKMDKRQVADDYQRMKRRIQAIERRDTA